MNVLVVGGNQFLGAELVTRMLLDGHAVTVLALDAPREDVRAHVRWVRANRDDARALEKALAGASFDAVVDNIAREASQVRLLREALRGRLGRYVLTSSVDLYGMHAPREPREEDAALEPAETEGFSGHERYVRGKRACEKELAAGDVPWSVVRPCMVTGRLDNIGPGPLDWLDERDWSARSRSLAWVSRVLDGGPVLLRADDRAVFRLAWVQDVARALALAATDPRAVGQAFNATGDEAWTSAALVRALGEAAGVAPQIETVSYRALWAAGLADLEPPYGRGPYWSVASNAKLRALGWKPTPAATWMAKLVESAPPERPDTRPRELALALHAARTRGRTLPPPLAREATGLWEPPLAGRLSAPASRAWAERVSALAAQEKLPAPSAAHWRACGEAVLGGIGLGTYPGAEDDATDALYRDVLLYAVPRGINVIDTAINYRGMRSERVVGAAVRELEARGVPRRALLVATKGGFVPADSQDGRSPADYVRDRWVRPGLLSLPDAARGHSLSAKYLRASLEQSLENLGLAHVDVFFLHNPELARPVLGSAGFSRALTDAFAMLEEECARGCIGAYGLATWEGLRVAAGAAQHVDLGAAAACARAVAGDGHHFRFVQLPFNAQKPEAWTKRNHEVDGTRMSALDAARELGLYVLTSASVLQGGAGKAERVPKLPGLGAEAAALQLTRSVPGAGTALVGTRRLAHVREALKVAALDALTEAEVANFLE